MTPCSPIFADGVRACGVAHALVALQLVPHAYRRRLRHRAIAFTAAFRPRSPSTMLARQPPLQRERPVRVPFVTAVSIGAPVSRITNSLSRGGSELLEPQIVAHRARAAHHLGTAQQRHERAGDIGGPRRLELLDRLLLRIRQLVGRNRRHPILRAADARRCRPPGIDEQEHELEHRALHGLTRVGCTRDHCQITFEPPCHLTARVVRVSHSSGSATGDRTTRVS